SHGLPERGDANWLDHQGSFMAAIAAQPVFRLLGQRALGRSDDYTTEKMPGVNEGLLDGALAWRQHDGGHTDGPNVEHFIRWAEARWGEDRRRGDSARPGDPVRPEPDRRSLKGAAGSPAVMARTVLIVAGPDLAAPARHGLAKFEAAARVQGWEIDRAASAEAARGDVIVVAALADAVKALPFAPVLARSLDAPEALAVKKFELA